MVIQGSRRNIGVGSAALLSLEEAREQALKNKRLARSGGDPIAEKRISIGGSMSFKEVALAAHELNAPTYRNKNYAAQWLSSIENHVLPIIGAKSIGSITSSDISVLLPIWSDKHDTAKKIRQRLYADYEVGKGAGLSYR